ncbi:von Willebrand factor type A [Schleiferia thermophila str. Yellowstone]|jgi:Ca-activated chloride channel family protein|nr:von Willebrand factor type A [Schleiferia thermophila str. Yellowstone]
MQYIRLIRSQRTMKGYRFSIYTGKEKSPFERYLDIFKEMLLYTSGDVDEAIDWLRELDKQYDISGDPSYKTDQFLEDLKKRGLLREEIRPDGRISQVPSARMEQLIRQNALEQIFGKLRKTPKGNHKTKKSGTGDEMSENFRPYTFGDSISSIDWNMSLLNAQRNSEIENFQIREEDLVVRETFHNSQVSTVLMIDISHSMILYGEDRITPAKKVALALSELIKIRYPKDTLDLLVFGDDAWPVSIGEIPYLQVGPYHTNTVAGLQLAIDILRKRKATNKQIFMITDGKPSCIKEPDGTYYKNSFGLDDYIVGRCLNMAAQCRRLNIPITTFMIARDPYLQQFVKKFTQANKGKALYVGLKNLGEIILEDFEKNRIKKI